MTLAKLRNRMTPYILSLSILAGAYVGCNKDHVSSGDDLESRTKIAFASNRDGIVFKIINRDENFDVYVMNADGSKKTRLTDNPADDEYPSWSPDGEKIAFGSKRDGNSEVYVMNADGSEQKILTKNPGYDGYPVWSPDGKKIAFMSARDGNEEIYVMNADGSEQRNLTNNPTDDVYLSWSPFLPSEK